MRLGKQFQKNKKKCVSIWVDENTDAGNCYANVIIFGTLDEDCADSIFYSIRMN